MFKAKNHHFGFFIGYMMYHFLSQALLRTFSVRAVWVLKVKNFGEPSPVPVETADGFMVVGAIMAPSHVE